MTDFNANPLAFMRAGDTVEDRSMMTGTGTVVYFKGNFVTIRYNDGSEEDVDWTLFVHYDERHWII